MKNILILSAFLLFSASAFGQMIPKGALIGVHNVTLKLNGSTTEAQYLAALESKFIPVFSKAFECEVHVLNYVRGESENKIGFLFVFKDAATRDKYYNPEGVLNDAGRAAWAKVEPIEAELSKLGTRSTSSYIDWGVR
jgi:hypothetical protein|uniref:hypothetical protein n=1 Tax=Algoriphagus sp. TaxID=1872435 RepID=UPI00404851B6